MNRNSWLDLTPLLDIFLILLFAVLINQAVGQRQLEADYVSALNQLKSDNTQLALEMGALQDLASAPMIGAGDERRKYDFLVEKVLVIDLEIRSTRNQVWINNEPTTLYLVDQPERQALQKQAILRELDVVLSRFSAGAPMGLVTLKADTSAYRYAYLITLDAIQTWVDSKPLPQTYWIQLN